jgi:Tfp pilus assembly protein FimV
LLVVVVVGLVAAVLLVPGLVPLGGPAPKSSAVVPSGAPPSTGPSAAPTFVRPTPSPAPSFTSYTVRGGDSLTSIARRFRTTARSIAWWNRGMYPSLDPQSAAYDPNTIRVGWVLNVLPDTVVDENDPPPPGPTAQPTSAAVTTPVSPGS